MSGVQNAESDNRWWGPAALLGYQVGSAREDCRAAARSEVSFTRRLRSIQQERELLLNLASAELN